MAGASTSESIIESAAGRGPGGRRGTLAAAVVLIVAAVVGIVVWRSRGAEQPGAPASSPEPRASELYAADGTTLIARFDTTRPRESCLRVPVNDWGYFCDYFITWWQAQPTFGADAAQRLDRLRHGGYRIDGSLDPRLQAGAKLRVDALLPVTDPKVFSLAAIEPGTGLVRTMAVNRNFRRPPPPASPAGQDQPEWRPAGPDLMDPLVSGDADMPGTAAGAPFMMFTLAAALDSGLTLDHAIDTKRVYQSNYRIAPQSPAACNGGHWCPANTGDPAYLSGRRTMWDAFGHSVVTYFVALQERIGADKAIAMAKRLGIVFRSKEDQMLSEPAAHASWGAFTLGVSATTALDLANAYATLAADGTRCDPLPVARLADGAGRPVAGVGPHCESVLRPEVARAAIDAGRCPLGDRSAFGDRCGAGSVATTVVRDTVGRPVAGQFGLTGNRGTFSLVVAAPQLATAGMVASAPMVGGGSVQLDAGLTAGAIGVIAGVERDGLAPLPVREFTAPPRELAIAP
ncbi:penicillin-binding transpeptidase domain-containing protein [Dactylosporangium sp. NPDC049525]|uniref:penicillin-binding transpeptidase domain-containing protein n=1 Tax=Dactylosporangium sp. NPDC049525 TaxID=3154730 RepID=UPI00342C7077